jgi:asparagine synthase (glutamine-hydrolysing)
MLRKISKALDISQLSIPDIIQETQALFSDKELNTIMNQDYSFLRFDSYNESLSLLRNGMLYRLKYDLPFDMLVKVDRMSMANSLEVRSPFLDPVLFEASCLIPDHFLRNKGLGKLVIREMMKDDLPDIVFNHPKSGFSIPLHTFRNEAFASLAKRLLNKSYMKELFSPQILRNIIETGLVDLSSSGEGSIYRKTHQLWSLMMLSGWIEMYKVEID